MQQYPICWECETPVEHSAVFAAPCDHERCISAVFHGLCLMQWREKREEWERKVRSHIEKHMGFQYPDHN